MTPSRRTSDQSRDRARASAPLPGGGRPRRLAKRTGRWAALAAMVALAAACSEFEASFLDPGDDEARLTLNAEVPSASGGSAVRAPRASVTVDDDGGNTLTIDLATLVLLDIQAGREGGACEFPSSSESDRSDDGDACAEFVFQTSALDLPVADGDSILTSVDDAQGTYDRLELQLEVADATEEFNIVQERQELDGASVLVEGTFNGEDFSVTLDTEERATPSFPSSVTVPEGGAATFTLTVDVASWFFRDDGSLVDPSTLADDPEAEALVESNVIASFSASGERTE